MTNPTTKTKTTAADSDLRFESQGYNWIIGIDNSDGGKFKISSSTAIGTSDRLAMDGSGNVGIGTTNPGAKLEVAGLGNQLRLSDGNSPSANYYDIVRNPSTGYLDFQGSQAAANGFLFKNSSAATILSLTSTQKLGVGKTPAANLDVQGTAAINGDTSLLGNITGGASSALYYDSSNIQLRIGNSPASGLFFGGQGEFQARRESANATIRIVTVGTGNNSYLAFDRARGTIASPTGIKSGDVIGSVVGVGYDGVSPAMTHGPEIILSTTEDWDATHNGNRIDFYTIANGTTNTVNTLALNQGSVGIGTTTPTTQLQVTTSSANATSTMELGKTGQNKGSCLKMYDVTGAVKYVTIQGGSLAISDTSCQ